MPQIPLNFLVSPSAELPAFALEVETPQLLQALKRIASQTVKSEWIHLRYALGILLISSGDTSLEVRAAGSWTEVVSVARSWVPAVLGFPLPQQVTTLRVENGKLFAQDVGVGCITGSDSQANQEIAERQKRVNAAAAALNRYGVSAKEIEELVMQADAETARLWGPNDDRIVRDVANAWQCLASYGVEASAVRRLLVKKSRDLWKDSGKMRPAIT